jgi:hypothetical protein
MQIPAIDSGHHVSAGLDGDRRRRRLQITGGQGSDQACGDGKAKDGVTHGQVLSGADVFMSLTLNIVRFNGNKKVGSPSAFGNRSWV